LVVKEITDQGKEGCWEEGQGRVILLPEKMFNFYQGPAGSNGGRPDEEMGGKTSHVVGKGTHNAREGSDSEKKGVKGKSLVDRG